MQVKGDDRIFTAAMAGKGGSPSFFAYFGQSFDLEIQCKRQICFAKRKHDAKSSGEIIDCAENVMMSLCKITADFCFIKKVVFATSQLKYFKNAVKFCFFWENRFYPPVFNEATVYSF